MAEPVPSTPEASGALMTSDRQKFEAMVKASDAKVD